jgi:signal transduction histidine kinase
VRSRGQVVGVGLIVRDVTPEKRAEELQRFLVGIVGHDLRNPLSALTTTLELFGRLGGLSDRQLALAARMRSAADRMKRLIDDLLDYTRVRGGGGIPIERRPVHLGEVVESVVEEMRAAHPDRAIELRGAGDGAGEWDPDRLRQVLSNMVTNALKYGDAGRAVEVAWRGAGPEVAIEVKNHGPPIPPDALPTLFEPLTQAATQRGRTGIGLGLFIARQLVQAHGGRVDARSDADGTVFTVRLPRDASRATPPAGPA